MDRLMDPLPTRHEPEIDYAKRARDLTRDPSLFCDLSNRSDLWSLTFFDMTLRQ
jgi:hypothetical protein